MTISNQASGIRPGVCTSTTRPTAPYTGQIIFETDTGLTQVWNGSTWKPVTTTSITASDGYLRYQTSWTTVTYNTGWQAYSAGSWGEAQYYRTVDGVVHLRGLIQRASGTNTTAFTLPVGYRPPFSHLFAVAASGGVGRWDVQPGGAVVWQGAQSGTINIADWQSLFEIKFSVF